MGITPYTADVDDLYDLSAQAVIHFYPDILDRLPFVVSQFGSTRDEFQQIRNWCEENLGPHRDEWYEVGTVAYLSAEIGVKKAFRFRTLESAMAFKLAWSK